MCGILFDRSDTEKTMSEKKKEHRFGINARMYIIISRLVFISCFAAILIASVHYILASMVNFVERGYQIVDNNSDFFDDPFLKDYVDIVSDDRFDEVRKKAAANQDVEMILEHIYAENEEMSEFVKDTTITLDTARKSNKIENVYLIRCNDEHCYFLLGGSDELLRIGEELPYHLEGELMDNSEVTTRMFEGPEKPGLNGMRTVALKQVLMGYDPVYHYWLAGENDVGALLKEDADFLKEMLLFLLVITVMFALIGSLRVRKRITNPLIRLKKDAEKYTSESTMDHIADPIDSGIKTSDELQDLSDSIYLLEKRVSESQEALKQEAEEKGRLKESLSIATEIQHGVLPSEFPKNDIYDLFAMMQSAKEVGGDFYDFFYVGDDRLVLVIGDVSDKGIPAALFMMTTKTLLKAKAASGADPAEILETVNRTLCDVNPAGMFVTVWIGIVDLKSGRMKAANGGHEYPILYRKGQDFRIFREPHGMVLGAVETSTYDNYEVQLSKGDRIFVYSDGATDAIRPDKSQYGLDRLLATVRECGKDRDAKGLVDGVLAALEEFSKDAYQFDDITLLSLTYHGDSKPKAE